MVRRTTLNISLTEELQQLLDDKVKSGRYGSASEVVREGLRLIEHRDRLLNAEELRAKIDLGWQQSQRKEGRDGETVFAEMRKRLVGKVAQKARRWIEAKARMTHYKLTPAAEQDLAEIIDHIAANSPHNALKTFDKIRSAARLLADMPLMGHIREEITDKPVRFWSVYNYLIIYRPEKKPLEILRIVHGARDLERGLDL